MWLDEVIAAQKRGLARGIPSICSAHPEVMKAAIAQAARSGAQVLIEATCNQVNHLGGYTGMTPADFARTVNELALAYNLPRERLRLGGDHLGPAAWQREPAGSAMAKSAKMVEAYVQAGFSKIHLDCSMRLADDPALPLEIEIAARRAAQLAWVAEKAHSHTGGTDLRYVIGTEVPVPGGALEHGEKVKVTRVEDLRQTLQATRQAFYHLGLEAAWERVGAVVVQPGVEFGDDFVLEYQPEAAIELTRYIESEPRLVYEAHSTDYQSRQALRNLVRDHFAILKVGPALTFAYREAVFALAMMENELHPPAERSNLIAVVDEVMVRQPEHWARYYQGTPEQQAYQRKFSMSDRVRYYWQRAEIQAALGRLLRNLAGRAMPLALLSQFLPGQAARIRVGELQNNPQAVIRDRISDILWDYTYACA